MKRIQRSCGAVVASTSEVVGGDAPSVLPEREENAHESPVKRTAPQTPIEYNSVFGGLRGQTFETSLALEDFTRGGTDFTAAIVGRAQDQSPAPSPKAARLVVRPTRPLICPMNR